MNNVVAFRRTPKLADPEQVSAIVVAGSGGAAATTTTYGLATALRVGSGVGVAAVDGTSDGGNLLERVGVEAIGPDRVIRQLESSMAVSTAGVVVVGHGAATSSSLLVDGLLADRQFARVHDVGLALRSPRMKPLIEAGSGIVVVAPARSEPLSRTRSALEWLVNTYGRDVLSRTVITISHQMPQRLVDLTAIREALEPITAGVVEVPFDEVLARPGSLNHTTLSVGVMDAWTDVLDALGRVPAAGEDAMQTGELA